MALHVSSLRSDPPHVVFQECPDEISLCFSFYGCPLRCTGCHSEELWDEQGGEALSIEKFEQYLTQYKGLITAVVFFGGEWRPHELKTLLQVAQQSGLKTCLYTGLNHVSRHLRPYLNFAKIGPWRHELGGLSHPNTNQHFYRLERGQFVERLNHLFITDEVPLTSSLHESSSLITTITQETQHVAA